MNDLEQLFDPGIGHNQPPGPIEEARERVALLSRNADAWAAVQEIADMEQAARLSDALDQLDAEYKKLDALRIEEKRPHDEAARAVQARWKPLLDQIGFCRTALLKLRNRWLAKEQARLDAERRAREEAAAAARHAAEEAARKAAAAARIADLAALADAQEEARRADEALAALPDRARLRGNLGGRARSLRTVRKAVVIDYPAAFQHFQTYEEVRTVINRLANAAARAGATEIPGCKIYEEQI